MNPAKPARFSQILSLSVLAVFTFSTFSAPFAEASLWSERRNALQTQESKKSEVHQAAASAFLLPRLSTGHSTGLHLPENLGTVVESWYPAAPADSAPLVIHIQDAHQHYGAQKNASKILESLETSLVCVEGASRRVHPEWISVLPDQTVKASMAESLLKEASITGEEYAAILKGGLEIQGIEDEQVYQANLKTRKMMDPERRGIERQLGLLSARLDRIKRRVYSEELLALDRASALYDAQQSSLADHVRFLRKSAPSAWNAAGLPNLSQILDVYALEQTLSLRSLEDERKKLVESLSSGMDKASLAGIVQMSLNYRLGKLSALQFHQGLLQMAKIHGLPAPQVESYCRYLAEGEKINVESIVSEISRLENSVYAVHTSGREDFKTLVQMNSFLRIQKKFWSEGFSPQDWQTYSEGGSMDHQGWKEIHSFVNEQESRLHLPWINPDFNYSGKPVSVSRVAQPKLTLPEMKFLQESYYKLAFKRDSILAENTLQLAKQASQNRVVLIAGGFHTPGITRHLKSKNVPFVVVRPHLTAVESGGKIPASEKTDFKSLLSEYIKELQALRKVKDAKIDAEVLETVLDTFQNRLFFENPVRKSGSVVLNGRYEGKRATVNFAMRFAGKYQTPLVATADLQDELKAAMGSVRNASMLSGIGSVPMAAAVMAAHLQEDGTLEALDVTETVPAPATKISKASAGVAGSFVRGTFDAAADQLADAYRNYYAGMREALTQIKPDFGLAKELFGKASKLGYSKGQMMLEVIERGKPTNSAESYVTLMGLIGKVLKTKGADRESHVDGVLAWIRNAGAGERDKLDTQLIILRMADLPDEVLTDGEAGSIIRRILAESLNNPVFGLDASNLLTQITAQLTIEKSKDAPFIQIIDRARLSARTLDQPKLEGHGAAPYEWVFSPLKRPFRTILSLVSYPIYAFKEVRHVVYAWAFGLEIDWSKSTIGKLEGVIVVNTKSRGRAVVLGYLAFDVFVDLLLAFFGFDAMRGPGVSILAQALAGSIAVLFLIAGTLGSVDDWKKILLFTTGETVPATVEGNMGSSGSREKTGLMPAIHAAIRSDISANVTRATVHHISQDPGGSQRQNYAMIHYLTAYTEDNKPIKTYAVKETETSVPEFEIERSLKASAANIGPRVIFTDPRQSGVIVEESISDELSMRNRWAQLSQAEQNLAARKLAEKTFWMFDLTVSAHDHVVHRLDNLLEHIRIVGEGDSLEVFLIDWGLLSGVTPENRPMRVENALHAFANIFIAQPAAFAAFVTKFRRLSGKRSAEDLAAFNKSLENIRNEKMGRDIPFPFMKERYVRLFDAVPDLGSNPEATAKGSFLHKELVIANHILVAFHASLIPALFSLPVLPTLHSSFAESFIHLYASPDAILSAFLVFATYWIEVWWHERGHYWKAVDLLTLHKKYMKDAEAHKSGWKRVQWEARMFLTSPLGKFPGIVRNGLNYYVDANNNLAVNAAGPAASWKLARVFFAVGAVLIAAGTAINILVLNNILGTDILHASEWVIIAGRLVFPLGVVSLLDYYLADPGEYQKFVTREKSAEEKRKAVEAQATSADSQTTWWDRSPKLKDKLKQGRPWELKIKVDGKEMTVRAPWGYRNSGMGGAHTFKQYPDSNISMQEAMFMPISLPGREDQPLTIEDAQEMINRLQGRLLEIINKTEGCTVKGIGLEGGLAPIIEPEKNDKIPEQRLWRLMVQAMGDEGFTPGVHVAIALDPAASELENEFRKKFEQEEAVGRYYFYRDSKRSTVMDREELLEIYIQAMMEGVPIISIEDGFSERDIAGWKLIMERMGNRVLIVGDDLVVTNDRIIDENRDVITAQLTKANQIGTVAETILAMLVVLGRGKELILSHRSQSPNDTFEADFAVGVNSLGAKFGGGANTERLVKFGRINEIMQQASHGLNLKPRDMVIKDFRVYENPTNSGNPTVMVEVITEDGRVFSGSTPLGTSSGEGEAIHLTDDTIEPNGATKRRPELFQVQKNGDGVVMQFRKGMDDATIKAANDSEISELWARANRYKGKGVRNAVHNVKHAIAPVFIGRRASDLGSVVDIDRTLLGLELATAAERGKNVSDPIAVAQRKGNLGMNAILAASLALARLKAASEGGELWLTIRQEMTKAMVSMIMELSPEWAPEGPRSVQEVLSDMDFDDLAKLFHSVVNEKVGDKPLYEIVRKHVPVYEKLVSAESAPLPAAPLFSVISRERRMKKYVGMDGMSEISAKAKIERLEKHLDPMGESWVLAFFVMGAWGLSSWFFGTDLNFERLASIMVGGGLLWLVSHPFERIYSILSSRWAVAAFIGINLLGILGAWIAFTFVAPSLFAAFIGFGIFHHVPHWIWNANVPSLFRFSVVPRSLENTRNPVRIEVDLENYLQGGIVPSKAISSLSTDLDNAGLAFHSIKSDGTRLIIQMYQNDLTDEILERTMMQFLVKALEFTFQSVQPRGGPEALANFSLTQFKETFRWTKTALAPSAILPLTEKKTDELATALARSFNVPKIIGQWFSLLVGQFTGRINIPLLKKAGAQGSIIGHSETRQLHEPDTGGLFVTQAGDTDEQINEKLHAAFKAADGKFETLLLAVGEPQWYRDAKGHVNYVLNQLAEDLNGLTAEQVTKLIIAYEPIWSIGEGKKPPTNVQIQEMHDAIRSFLVNRVQELGQDAGLNIPILYGGSVKPENAKEIFSVKNVNGALVGGASLEAKSFRKIAETAETSGRSLIVAANWKAFALKRFGGKRDEIRHFVRELRNAGLINTRTIIATSSGQISVMRRLFSFNQTTRIAASVAGFVFISSVLDAIAGTVGTNASIPEILKTILIVVTPVLFVAGSEIAFKGLSIARNGGFTGLRAVLALLRLKAASTLLAGFSFVAGAVSGSFLNFGGNASAIGLNLSGAQTLYASELEVARGVGDFLPMDVEAAALARIRMAETLKEKGSLSMSLGEAVVPPAVAGPASIMVFDLNGLVEGDAPSTALSNLIKGTVQATERSAPQGEKPIYAIVWNKDANRIHALAEDMGIPNDQLMILSPTAASAVNQIRIRFAAHPVTVAMTADADPWTGIQNLRLSILFKLADTGNEITLVGREARAVYAAVAGMGYVNSSKVQQRGDALVIAGAKTPSNLSTQGTEAHITYIIQQ